MWPSDTCISYAYYNAYNYLVWLFLDHMTPGPHDPKAEVTMILCVADHFGIVVY